MTGPILVGRTRDRRYTARIGSNGEAAMIDRSGWMALASCLALIAWPGPMASAQLAPPMIRGSRPLGASPGESVALEVRGSDVRDGAWVRFDDPRVRVEGIDLDKAEGNGIRTFKARVTVPAATGPLTFRVVTDGGVSDPGRILVGRSIPSTPEVEPNDRLRKPQVVTGPVAVEGSISPGDDVDVFAVEMKAGETLVAEAIAARAGSRLDAWVTIFSPDGRELAADDDRFGRDAAAWATVPSTGLHLVAIQDANGRSRDNAIEQKMTRPYRLEIGRIPLVASAYPLGARRGRGIDLRLIGANLPPGRLDVPPDAAEGDLVATLRGPLGDSNALTLRVGDAVEFVESEPNDDAKSAPTVAVPAAINGTFGAPGAGGADVDVFRLKAAPGREGDYAITVHAARLGSAADPVLALADAKGEDTKADRIVRRVDSGDGLLISVRDSFGRGGDRFLYRIEVEPVGRSVTITADLANRTVPRSGVLAVPVTVDRRGFDGPVTVLAGPLPAGVAAAPITIPPGETGGILFVAASDGAPDGPFPFLLTARDIPAPANFAFRERGPIDEVPREGDPKKGPRETTVDTDRPILAVTGRAPIGLTPPTGPVVVPPGGQVELRFALERRPGGEKKPLKVRLQAAGKALELFEPAKDIDVAADAGSASIVLKAKADAAPRSVTLSARAWFDGSPDVLGVDSPGFSVVVPAKADVTRP